MVVDKIKYHSALKNDYRGLHNSYTMDCQPVYGDNPRGLASGLSPVQVNNPWYNCFIPPASVYEALRSAVGKAGINDNNICTKTYRAFGFQSQNL